MDEFGRGVLYPRKQASIVDLERRPPGPELRPFVEHYWHVRWRTPEPYDTKVLSHPSVHLVFEEPEPLVYGVDRDLFVRRLEGAGQVLGVKFRPGCFRAFAGRPVAELADGRFPAAEFFGPRVREASREILGTADTDVMAKTAGEFLLPRLPAPDPVAAEVAEMVARLTAAPSVFRVGQAAELLHVSSRTLQRLFAEYVGASPKWVLRRARLHEAATRADRGDPVDWAALAGELGYYDQAHLVRDFTAAVGEPPARYAR
ncbi:helix-turn-helix domain-containing protein [Actinomadura sp. WMMB 499]|uniref:AraC family transcriptional regulator n=1 Tax=Actinomadura sp. WMMB 499 TaxID=1219491 RepID=UPI0012450234|nr:helix-turn-helix domain-containing protein [Actinomadura sp. WMMB 499]QFG24515.1 AraC family transcriptional regulator [Actinomadura sp. WMMB 499]